MTSIPDGLFDELLLAGEMARGRGQHVYGAGRRLVLASKIHECVSPPTMDPTLCPVNTFSTELVEQSKDAVEKNQEAESMTSDEELFQSDELDESWTGLDGLLGPEPDELLPSALVPKSDGQLNAMAGASFPAVCL